MEETQSPNNSGNLGIPIDQNEVSLLDLLVTMAENARLLIVGPLLVGLGTLGVSYILPQTFESISVLQVEQSIASIMVTATVLDPVVVKLGLDKGGSVEEARRLLRDQIKSTMGSNDKLLTLTVAASTSQQAQVIARAVLEQTYLQSRPKGSVRKRLEVQLAEVQGRFKNAENASANLLKSLISSSAGTSGANELASGYSDMLKATDTALTQIGAIEAQLEGVSEAQLLQAPTLPLKASRPQKALLTVGATLTTGLVLLLFIFMRQALLNTANNAETAGKLDRIRRALGLKKTVFKN
jgi:uncharacterized protein involved in exopolysaccharide biosynthesis